MRVMMMTGRGVTQQVCLVLGLGAMLMAMGGCAGGRMSAERSAYHQENTELQEKLQRAYAARDALAVEVESLRTQLAGMSRRPAAMPQVVEVVRESEPAQANRFAGIGDIEVFEDRAAGTVTVRVPGDVLFASGKVDLRQAAKSTLEQVAGVLKSDYPDAAIRVEGYTDSDPIKRSPWKDNLELSLQRAAAVHRFLETQGVNSDQMYAAGFGPAKPQATKASSRRVEIVVEK